MLRSLDLPLVDEAATVALAERLAAALDGGLVLYLQGELGAGKTRFARALLQALGVGERVKSPTYSLIEPYTLASGQSAWHLDLYRIADASELEWLGLDALSEPQTLVLVEWPEHGQGGLPPADLELLMVYQGTGRRAHLRARSSCGERVLDRLGRSSDGL